MLNKYEMTMELNQFLLIQYVQSPTIKLCQYSVAILKGQGF